MSWEEPKEREFRGLDLLALETDNAYLNVTSQLYSGGDDVFLYSRSKNCYGCPYQLVDKVPSDGGLQLDLLTHYPWFFRLRRDGEEDLVSEGVNDQLAYCGTGEQDLGEFGVYDLILTNDGDCSFSEALEPVNPNLAILYAFLILLLLGAVYRCFTFSLKRGYLDGATRWVRGFLKSAGFDVKTEVERKRKEEEASDKPQKKRLKSLDTFRGFSMAILIFVNDGAAGYWFFEHATWNGLNVADLAFPWFMWIMGFCIPMSVRSSIRRKATPTMMLWKITTRSAKLFALGFIQSNINHLDLSHVRIMGVLQRFALVYFVVAATCSMVMLKGAEVSASQGGWLRHVADILSYWQRWLVALSCVAIHTCVLYLLPVPGCPTGYLGPGGLADDARYSPRCVGGASGHIDRVILTEDHMYRNNEVAMYYRSAAYDPEGFLGCLNAAFQVFLGCQAGYTILTYQGHLPRLLRFLAWGLVTGGLALLLCQASLNDGWVPINKNLWSTSYALATTSLAFFLMTLMYTVIDVFYWWGGEPFFYAGMNSIVVYLGRSAGALMFPFNYVAGDMNTHWEKLVETLWGVALWLFVAYVMYRRKVFIVL